NDRAKSILQLPNGQVLAVGSVLNSQVGIVRYNVDGTIDKTFGFQGKAVLDLSIVPSDGVHVNGAKLDSTGRIILFGSGDQFNSGSFVARLTADGELDSSFNGGSGVVVFDNQTSSINDIAFGPDGTIVLAGSHLVASATHAG